MVAPTSAPPESPRGRLLQAAESQFRRFGYRRTTVDEITREAGTGKGSFYLHFPSKEEAYLAVVEASLQPFLDRAAVALAADGPAPERMRALVEVTAEHYGHDELLRASLFGGAGLVDGEVARRASDIQRRRIRSLMADALRAGQREGSIRPSLDPDATAAVLFEAGWAIVRAELEGNADLPLTTALTTLSEITGVGVMRRDASRRAASARRAAP